MKQDPLAQLKPIHLTDAPGWFPPAIGWWLLMLAVVLLLTALVLYWRRRQQRRAPLKQALAELDQLQHSQQGLPLMQQLNQLLRRAARQSHGAQAASLGATDWAAFLQRHAAGDTPEDLWQSLAQSPYSGHAPEHCGRYIAHSRAWLKDNLTC